jgi:hypothetical protein
MNGGSSRRKAPTYTQNNTNTEHIDIQSLSGIRTHNHSVRADENNLCPRTRRQCDRQYLSICDVELLVTTGASLRLPHGAFALITKGR